MKLVRECPVCGSGKMLTLAVHSFFYPEDFMSSPAPDADYRTQRLWIFFSYIHTEDRVATIAIERCGNCGLFFSNPRMTPEEISLKYSVIESLESSGPKMVDSISRKAVDRAERIKNYVEQTLGHSAKNLNILDFGGAEGHNLIPLSEDNKCYVIDQVKCEMPPGIAFLGRQLKEVPDGLLFDLIILSHVLEHATAPLQMLKKLASCLKEDGHMYVEVPLGTFREWKKLAEPLTHLNFFSEQSLAYCLQLAGFEIRRISTQLLWVKSGRKWCVSSVARKTAAAGRALPEITQASAQMGGLRLYFPYIACKLFERASRALRRWS